MLASKLTSKYQASVPEKVRSLLGLEAGDRVIWEIENGRVTVKKAVPLDLEYVQALEKTLPEWGSKNDEEAYRDL